MQQNTLTVVSLFAGVGGLDLGFKNAGFDVIWANDSNKKLKETYKYNHKNTKFVIKKIQDLEISEIPEADVIIGGPPCQSWSLAGNMCGIDDERGQVFYNYINLVEKKQPKAFVVENVKGLISRKHIQEFEKIIKTFEKVGYTVNYKLLNAKNYGVCQNRERVFIIGLRKDLNLHFTFPKVTHESSYVTLKETIGDLVEEPGEYYKGSYSSIFMSRNRKKDWNDISFTIQAGARQIPLHPDSPEMIKIEKDKRVFAKTQCHKLRRLSIKECARIQGFDDNFNFIANNISDKYSMIGNAVPVLLAHKIAEELKKTLLNNKKI